MMLQKLHNTDVNDAANEAAVRTALEYGFTYETGIVHDFSTNSSLDENSVRTSTTSKDFEWKSYRPIVIICMSKQHRMTFGVEEAYAAGADLFVYEPEANFIDEDKLEDAVGPMEIESTSNAGVILMEHERLLYCNFATIVLNFMPKPTKRLLIDSSIKAGEIPTMSTLLKFPGMNLGKAYVGSKISLVGTLTDVNSMFQTMFYYSPPGIFGSVNLSINVIDHPRMCNNNSTEGNLQRINGVNIDGMTFLAGPSKNFNIPALNLLTDASVYGAKVLRHLPELEHKICDTNNTNSVTRVWSLFIAPVNSPPNISVKSSGKLLSDQFVIFSNHFSLRKIFLHFADIIFLRPCLPWQ